MESFCAELDLNMRNKNHYYDDLIVGGILQACVVRSLKNDAFIRYMKSQGKLGAQNKVPRLMNDRKIADVLFSSK